jgi:hypothetical protein
MPSRILALVSEPVSAEALKRTIGEPEAAVSEVLVIAPALNTRTRHVLSDPDPAIERAEEVMQESVERLIEEGVDATGDTGESDPVLALQDALATYPADRIVLFTHPDGERDWLEEGVVDEARERFDVPVEHIVIQRP